MRSIILIGAFIYLFYRFLINAASEEQDVKLPEILVAIGAMALAYSMGS